MTNPDQFDSQAFLRHQQEEIAARQATRENNIAARKALINRSNAEKSTGPRTLEGKAISSRNRLSHGLCSESILIPGESPNEFEQLQAEITAAYAPANQQERMLSDQLVVAQWRLNRVMVS